MAALAKRRMRRKIPLLEQALTGLMRDHHRRLLSIQLAHIDFPDEQIEALGTAIEASLTALSANETAPLAADGAAADNSPAAAESLPALTFVRAVELLDTISGVDAGERH
jgi:transposase